MVLTKVTHMDQPSPDRLHVLLLLGIACALLLLLPAPPAFARPATTFTVQSNADSPAPNDGSCATAPATCTLREAIAEAQNGDTINISTMTITLNAGELAISRDITIGGAGEGSTIIDGNSASRVFNFASGGTYALSGVTIQNGNCAAPCTPGGGGVYNAGTLMLSNVTITNSKAMEGGGVYNAYRSSSLTLNSVTLSGNTATGTQLGQGGGGLWNGHALTANNVTITGNSAYQGAGYYNNSDADATFTGFTISGNTAWYAGGGVNDDQNLGAAKIVMTGGTIMGNTATAGAGIDNDGGTMILTNVTVSNNIATPPGPLSAGGGILTKKVMTLNGVTINGNKANFGAGILNGGEPGNSLSITNSTISGNGTEGVGGGSGLFMLTAGTVNMLNVTISANAARDGGGINTSQGAGVSLKMTILVGNTGTGAPDCYGSVGSLGYNLVGDNSGCSFAATTGDQVNVSAGLGALGNNGGPTQTMPIGPGSNALDMGTNAGCPGTDQRGITRPQGTACDIGAYEYVQGTSTPSLFMPMVLR